MPAIYLVDAFADRPFTGNPAGVVPLESMPDESWMQQVAMEMNQAETAFFAPEGDGYRLRWFTPTVEVDLCGHATLASAHILFSELGHSGEIRFATRSGPLICRQEDAAISLDFPAEPVSQGVLASPVKGLRPVWSGRNRMDWLVQVASIDEVLSFSPILSEVAALGQRGLIVTAAGGEGVDFTSRCFFPQAGVDEDPVTGSAHCALAPYWAERLGKTDLVGRQASRRGGNVRCAVQGNRVVLRGRAITTVRGELQVR